jgi:hypothetical protein
MAETFVFEELDSATREYLIAVRDAKGEGAPGIFVPTSSAFAGCGCIGGPIIIIFTLVATLTSWPKDLVYKEPGKLAMLQTAGLLLGGWLAIAGIRAMASKGGKTSAGNWIYVDSLYLYEACREQVTMTPLEDLVEATYTHNYNEGNYQNSVVRLVIEGAGSHTVTINNKAKAEQFTSFLNYLAWARGSEGGERGKLSAAKLGAMAKYVSLHDHEPKDSEDNFDFDLVDLEIDNVPEEHIREGQAAPSILPYVIIILSGVGIFFTMWKIVNPAVRDEAIAEVVLAEPVEPIPLRAYLIDERNTRHRTEAIAKLEQVYARAIATLKSQSGGKDAELRDGFMKILDSVKGPEQATVSLKVTEEGGKAGGDKRTELLRNEVVGRPVPHWDEDSDQSTDPADYFTAEGGILAQLARVLPPVSKPGHRTAVGLQLLEFAGKPEEAEHAHFEITYAFVPSNIPGRYALAAKVEFRTDLAAQPVVTYEEQLPQTFTENEFDQQIKALADRLVRGMVGGQ